MFGPKKLLGAVRWWCGASSGPDELAEDAKALGIDLPEAPADVYLVLEENWDAVRTFCACATQWRLSPSGQRIGLDYAAAQAAASGLGADWREVFLQLAMMEAEALSRFAATSPA